MSRPVAGTQPSTYPLNVPPQPTVAPVNPTVIVQIRAPVTDPRGTRRPARDDLAGIFGETSSEPVLAASPGSDSMQATPSAIPTIHALVAAGRSDGVAQCLLQSPLLRDALDQTGLTPLCVAAGTGQAAIAATLLAAGAPVDARARNHSTPLMFAAFAGHVDMIRVLLRAGADPNAINRTGWLCALHGVIQNKHLHAAQVLIEGGADLNLTPFDPAANQANPSPAVSLLTQGWTELIAWMIATGRWTVESEAMARITLLNVACLGGSLPSVQFLLAAGSNPLADFDLNGKHYKGGLWMADRRGQLNVVEYLLGQGIAVPMPMGSLPIADLGFLCPLTIDLVNHAALLNGRRRASNAGLTDLSFWQAPRKLIEGLVDRQIGVMPNARGWRNWLCACGMTNVIGILIDQHTKDTGTLLRALSGKQVMASWAQQLQRLVEVISAVCACESLTTPFSNKKMSEQGAVVMNDLVQQQRELLLQAVATLRDEQMQRLGTLPSLCVENYISVTHKLNETDLYRMLTQQWGLIDPVALTMIRVVKMGYERVRQVPASSTTAVFTSLSLAEQLAFAMTHVLEELDQHTAMPEFGKALRELDPGVDMEVFAALLFAQWRMVNQAHQVETQRFIPF